MSRAQGMTADPYRGLAGRRLALVESMLHGAFAAGIRRARASGLEVWLLIGDRGWYGSPADPADDPLATVDRLVEVDTSDLAAVLRVLSSPTGRPLVHGVTTFSDYHSELAATAARRLGLPGPAPDALATANHKDRLRDALGARPYNARHLLLTEPDQVPKAAAELGFPLVAKPPAEAISYGVRRVESVEQLEAAYRELSRITTSLRGQPRPGSVLVEEYLPGPQVSVETLTIDGETHCYGVTSRQALPGTFAGRAHSFPVRLPAAEQARLTAVVAQTLRLIGYRQGPCHTEVKLTPAGPRLLEVNPRLPAHSISTMVADVCGQDPHRDAMLLALGGRPRPPAGRHHGGAAVVVLYPDPPAGALAAVDGVARAAAVPGVTVSLHARPGDHLSARPDNSASVGFVYARGADAEAALATAERAAALVTVHTAREG